MSLTLRNVSRALSALSVLAIVGLSTSALGQGGQGNPGVAPPNSRVYGHSYGEWSAMWWQWAYSMPVDANPLFDTADVSAGQSGPVWFLGGSFDAAGPVVRNVRIPVGKGLFFPILNAEGATVEGNGTTFEELRQFPEWAMSFAQDLTCTVDGVPIRNLDSYLFLSPLFQYGPLPANNAVEYFGYPAPEGTVSNCVSKGCFLMLAPLSRGQHTIRFTGRFVFPDWVFEEDITYHITVVPGK